MRLWGGIGTREGSITGQLAGVARVPRPQRGGRHGGSARSANRFHMGRCVQCACLYGGDGCVRADPWRGPAWPAPLVHQSSARRPERWRRVSRPRWCPSASSGRRIHMIGGEGVLSACAVRRRFCACVRHGADARLGAVSEATRLKRWRSTCRTFSCSWRV